MLYLNLEIKTELDFALTVQLETTICMGYSNLDLDTADLKFDFILCFI